MREEIIQKIESLADIIYSLEKDGLNEEFIKLIDLIGLYIVENKMNLDEVLLRLQDSFIQKDYVIFSDILMYELKPLFGE